MDGLEDILVRKARLIERIAHQRRRLATNLQAVEPVFAAADRGAALLAGARQHAGWIAAAAGIVVALKPRRTLAWARRAFVAWRTLKWMRGTIGI